MIVASDRSLARKLVDKITDANREYIASVEAKIGENNGEQTIGSTSELNRVLEVLKTRTRRNHSNNALDSQGRANSDNGGVSVGESESDGIGYSQKGNGNKRSVKFALKDTVELQTDSRESQDNQGGVLGKNADNRRISNAILSDQGGVVRFNLST